MPPTEWPTGVYSIRNRLNNKRYVGSAAQSLEKRRIRHWSELRTGTHHNRYLQAAWDKYGEEAFEFVILQRCAPYLCVRLEQKWIDYYSSANEEFGYNLSPTAGSILGVKKSPEAIAKHVEVGKRLAADPSHRQKLREAAKKRYEDPEQRKKAAEVIKAWKADGVWKQKHKQKCEERNQDPEYQKKLQEGVEQRNSKAEYRAKLKRANKLRELSGGYKTMRRLKAIKQHRQGKFKKK